MSLNERYIGALIIIIVISILIINFVVVYASRAVGAQGHLILEYWCITPLLLREDVICLQLLSFASTNKSLLPFLTR